MYLEGHDIAELCVPNVSILFKRLIKIFAIPVSTKQVNRTNTDKSKKGKVTLSLTYTCCLVFSEGSARGVNMTLHYNTYDPRQDSNHSWIYDDM